MNRRQFLKMAALGSLYFGLGAPLRNALAADSNRVLLNLLLPGGPDFRHLLVPAYNSQSSSYGYAYWSHRYNAHNIGSSASAWQNRYTNDYTPITSGSTTFGVLNKASWLAEQFQAGNVAIISNAYGSLTRDHSHAMLVMESGDEAAGANDLGRNGWGGRLSVAAGGKLCSMTSSVRLFCNGPYGTTNLAHDNSNVLSANDSRSMGLSYPDSLVADEADTGSDATLARALRSYYDAKRDAVAETSPFKKFFVHEQVFREFGEAMDARLASETLPSSIEALYSGSATLNSTYFGQQIRNAYDCFTAADLLNFRVGSLEYGGWDSHKDQVSTIEPNIEDIFGANGGLATLMQALEQNKPDQYNNTVIVIAGEFGRQIAANGDQGTDHGRGNTVLVIGPGVRGGLYGDMFPQSEIARYDSPSADIDGLTSIEPIFASVCDWIAPGSGSVVLPNAATANIESGVSFANLFRT